ncbi:MAG: hypothetical protein KAR24_03540 [Candidatus Pacebacteria bacterium]|nr:hypothetical protein [Candidatus Paceibacterota bacterium]
MFEQPKKQENTNEINRNPAETYAEGKYVEDYGRLMDAPRTLEFFKSSRV